MIFLSINIFFNFKINKYNYGKIKLLLSNSYRICKSYSKQSGKFCTIFCSRLCRLVYRSRKTFSTYCYLFNVIRFLIMIDTNVLVLNNLQRCVNQSIPYNVDSNPLMYGNLIRFFLRNVKQKKFEGSTEFDMSLPDRKVILQVSEYHHKFSQGEKKMVWACGKVLTSSHYELGFRMPLGIDAPYVEMNFSVPKLIY